MEKFMPFVNILLILNINVEAVAVVSGTTKICGSGSAARV
jgi:hypothetical protein